MTKNIKTKTSVEVAEMVGKAHNKLMRDIRGYIKDLGDSPKVDSHNLFVGKAKGSIIYLRLKQLLYIVMGFHCPIILSK